MSFVRYGLNHRSLGALSSVNSRVKANRLTGLLLMAFALATLLTGSVPALAQSAVDYDVDDDGLIEVSNLDQLNAIRWDLDGNGTLASDDEAAYAAAFPNAVDGMGCPDTGCTGYELTADLDFDTNGNGEADAGDAYWNDGAGWTPIGAFNGEFHGNGHTISNLYINSDWPAFVGLFSQTFGSAYVHHVGLPNVNVTATGYDVGALVGRAYNNRTVVASSYATGSVSGGSQTGGLVGGNRGFVVNSWTDVAVTGDTHVGGVFGHNSGAAQGLYALGTVQGSVAHGVGLNDDAHHAYTYYDWTRHRGPHTDQTHPRTTAELQGPTGYTGIYEHWGLQDLNDSDGNLVRRLESADPWDFGTSSSYPRLKADRNGDGAYTAAEFGGQQPVSRPAWRDYDTDDDGLIEVSNLAQLDAIRHDLDGGGWTGGDFPHYTGAFPMPAYGMGCPVTGCKGYELIADLDFDTNGDGVTGAGDPYWHGGAGWNPLGRAPRSGGGCSNCAGAYSGEFHGNGHTISNLYINRPSWDDLGLFGAVTSSAFVHHVGLLNVNITGNDSQGALVGYLTDNTAAVAASYATGVISGGRWSGGLVGYSNGHVVASWTNMSVTGGTEKAGGVVGQNNGAVLSVYALGTVRGSGDTHGVVGYTEHQDNLRSAGVYYSYDHYPVSHSPYSRSIGELKEPTGYTGIYANWNVDTDRVGGVDDPWDFGASDELPALKADRNGDGVATWREFGTQMRGGRDYDGINDGLIDVSSLEKLNAIRFDLDGNGFPETGHAEYAAAFPDAAFGMGCGGGCKGYELTRDLNFDANRTGRVGVHDPYWNDGQGWRPIGYETDGAYTGEFHGNGHTIKYLFINRDGSHVGLFGLVSGSAYVHHVGLPNADVTTTGKDVGALVGFVRGNKARVSANYATGSVTGGKHTGGLVGSNQGYVRANWAEVRVRGTRHVGGLVGHNGGEVSASYSLGVVNGDSRVHGVVGWTDGGSLKDVYFRSDINPDVVDAHAKSRAELREPTGYTGIYQNWNADLDGKDGPDDPWDFWTDVRYPRLKADRNGDGRPTRQEFKGQNPGEGIRDLVDHDRDNDGLIEVSSMRQLNAVRFDMNGDGVPESEKPLYDEAFPEALSGMGCPDTGCKGYELTANLNHDRNGNGTFDQGDWPYDNGQGWRPIGFDNDGAYTGEFHGNGHTISNLHVNRDGKGAGLFGRISGSAYVHHVGLPDVNITATGNDVGALVGFIRGNKAAVAAAFATGSVTGGNQTGGLVGSTQGYVVTSWTNVTVNGARHVGGVVGHNGGSVHGVYALGTVTGSDRTHGVVGWTDGGHLGPAYYNSDNHSAEGADAKYTKTTAELQEPTGYTGIYAEWGLDSDRTDNAGFTRQGNPWDFGGSSDYPQLRAFQQPGGL